MKKLALLIFVAATLAGCGTTSGQIGELPAVVSNTDASSVTILRTSSAMGLMQGYAVALDGKEVLGIGSGEYSKLFVPEGEHTLTLHCFGNWSAEAKQGNVTFSAKIRENQFFLITPGLACGSIRAIDQGTAEKEMLGSRVIDLDRPYQAALR
jgi:uncharacterized protein YceK